MLSVITFEKVTSVNKTMHSRLKKSPEAGTRMEPANGFLVNWWHGCLESIYQDMCWSFLSILETYY